MNKPDLSTVARTPVGVDERFDQSGRQEIVEQNGNDGAIYVHLANSPIEVLIVESGDATSLNGLRRKIGAEGHTVVNVGTVGHVDHDPDLSALERRLGGTIVLKAYDHPGVAGLPTTAATKGKRRSRIDKANRWR